MTKISKNQHIMPKFLQNNFQIKNNTQSNKKIVKTFTKHIKPNQNPINIVSTKSNMSNEYTYGKKDQSFEEDLQKIESKASKIINEIIKDPDKYTNSNKTLHKDLINFITTLRYRSQISIDLTNSLEDQLISLYQKTNPNDTNNKVIEKILNRKNEKTMYLSVEKCIDEAFKSDPDLYSKEFLIIKSNKNQPIFLPDQIWSGLLPLSPDLLLIYGKDLIYVNKLINRHGKSYIIDYYNYLSLTKSYNTVIIGEQTNKWQIEKLNKKFIKQKPYLEDVQRRIKDPEIVVE